MLRVSSRRRPTSLARLEAVERHAAIVTTILTHIRKSIREVNLIIGMTGTALAWLLALYQRVG